MTFVRLQATANLDLKVIFQATRTWRARPELARRPYGAPQLHSYLTNNLGAKEDITASSDSKGQFSIELAPGFYDVFVTATAFSPHCEKIRLKGTGTKIYKVKLKISPVTSKELD